jgi:membrane protein
VLGLIGTLGHLTDLVGAATVVRARRAVLTGSRTALTGHTVDTVIRPMLDDVLRGGQAGIVSTGFVISLWSGSRAVNVSLDTIAIVSGHRGERGVIRTRLLSLAVYVTALAAGVVTAPLLVLGPATTVGLLPAGLRPLGLLYWPTLTVTCVAALTTLYHVAIPARHPWRNDLPGAVLALVIWTTGSTVLRAYLTGSVLRTSAYGSLAAPVAVLVWLYVTAMAILVGAALNSAVQRVGRLSGPGGGPIAGGPGRTPSPGR